MAHEPTGSTAAVVVEAVRAVVPARVREEPERVYDTPEPAAVTKVPAAMPAAETTVPKFRAVVDFDSVRVFPEMDQVPLANVMAPLAHWNTSVWPRFAQFTFVAKG